METTNFHDIMSHIQYDLYDKYDLYDVYVLSVQYV